MKTLLICAAFVAGIQAVDAFAQLPPGDGPATVSTTVNEPTPLKFDEALLARLSVPAGFKASVWARDAGNVRWMQVAPNGDVYVSRREQGDVMLLRGTDAQGRVAERRIVAQNLKWVHGLALRGGQLYMATDKKVLAAAVLPDNVIPWPGSLPEQVSAVQTILSAAGSPLAPQDVARAFKGKRAATVRPVLDALAGIGMARRLKDGRYAA